MSKLPRKLPLWFRIWLRVAGTLCALVGAFGGIVGFAFAFFQLIEHGHWVWAMLLCLFTISAIVTAIEYDCQRNPDWNR